MKKPFVLHIATNLNGGPGRVHLSTLKFSKNTTASFAHEFIILDEKHVTSDSLELFSEYSDSLHIGKNEEPLPGQTEKEALGSMILFPSYLVHRVLPMTKGTRYAMVGWCHGNSFR